MKRGLLSCFPVLLLLLAGPAHAEPPKAQPPRSKELAAGEVLPTRSQLRDLKGRVVDLGMLCGETARRFNPRRPRALLLDVYMTTCGPCNAALPELGQIAAAFRARGLRTLVISLDGTERAAGGQGVSSAQLRDKLAPARLEDGEIVRDPGQVLAEDLGLVVRTPQGGASVTVPRTFVVDGECKVRAAYASLPDKRQEAEQLLESLLQAP